MPVGMLMAEIGSEVLGTLPLHVGGEVALLRRLREAQSDVTEALRHFTEAKRQRSEMWEADEAYEDIQQRRLGFHDVPGHDALQLVWPHNMNLGRDVDGDVVRYERLGCVDVAALLRDFPLESGTAGPRSRGMEASDEEWRSALEYVVALPANGGEVVAPSVEVWLAQRRSEQTLRIADCTGSAAAHDVSLPHLMASRGEMLPESEAWTALPSPVEDLHV